MAFHPSPILYVSSITIVVPAPVSNKMSWVFTDTCSLYGSNLYSSSRLYGIILLHFIRHQHVCYDEQNCVNFLYWVSANSFPRKWLAHSVGKLVKLMRKDPRSLSCLFKRLFSSEDNFEFNFDFNYCRFAPYQINTLTFTTWEPTINHTTEKVRKKAVWFGLTQP